MHASDFAVYTRSAAMDVPVLITGCDWVKTLLENDKGAQDSLPMFYLVQGLWM